MEKRLIKQITIALVAFAIFASIGGIVYLVRRPDATCFDNRKNQGELETDCGGLCIPCALKNSPPLSMSGTPRFLPPADDKTIDILFNIANSSMEWGVKNFSYKVTILGENGEKQEFMESNFILPHESKTFLLPQVETGFTPKEVQVTVDFQTVVWAKAVEGLNLEAGDPFVLSNMKITYPKASEYTYQAYNPNSLNIYTFTKTLRPGMSGTEVNYLQKVLALDPKIYPEGEVSGYFGKLTEAAVKRFQKEYGIRNTGEVGDLTRGKLNELYGKKPVTHVQNIYTFTQTLKKGMEGEEVYNLQKVLHWDPQIYPEGEQTGYFGELTEAAVKRFQKKYGIDTTGQVGPQTRAKLNEIYAQQAAEGEGGLEPYEASLKIEGDVFNSTPFNWHEGTVEVIVCDTQHNNLAVGIIPIKDIPANKSIPFVIQWYRRSFPSEVTICEKVVNVNILDQDNAFISSP